MPTFDIKVAFEVEADSFREAQTALMRLALPRGLGDGELRDNEEGAVFAWWIAEDGPRVDRSDNDSCVFVKKGMQAAAHEILRRMGLAN